MIRSYPIRILRTRVKVVSVIIFNRIFCRKACAVVCVEINLQVVDKLISYFFQTEDDTGPVFISMA